jgi:hypothetical protein
MHGRPGRSPGRFSLQHDPEKAAPDLIRGGSRFPEKIVLKTKNLEHDPEKWNPVFRKDHAQTKS